MKFCFSKFYFLLNFHLSAEKLIYVTKYPARWIKNFLFWNFNPIFNICTYKIQNDHVPTFKLPIHYLCSTFFKLDSRFFSIIVLGRTQIYNELWTDSNLMDRTSNSLEPRFIHQNQTSNPFEHLQKAQTFNLFGQKKAKHRWKSGKI